MRRYIIGLLLLTTVIRLFPNYIKPEYFPYIDNFHRIAKEENACLNGYSLRVFSSPYISSIGVCYRDFLFKKATIIINENYWNLYNDDMRWALMAHELSHCLLGADHNPNSMHYMYASENYVDYQLVTFQLRGVMRNSCSEK